MKLKIFTLRLDPSTGKFDDQGLADFQIGKDIIDVSEHFLVYEKTPTLTLVDPSFDFRINSENFGMAIEAKTAMIATTTINSDERKSY